MVFQDLDEAEVREFRGRLRPSGRLLLLPLTAAAVAVVLIAWPTKGSSAPTVATAAHAVLKSSTARVPDAPVLPPAVTRQPLLPKDWLPARGRECFRTGKYRGFCQGPRRAPQPHGPEAALAERLGLGTIKTVSTLLLEAPKPEWVAAAGAADPRALLFPVAEGTVWRGLQRVRLASGRLGRLKHKGVDIGAREGAPIRAVQSGIVAYADNGVRGYGNLLVTVHPDQSTALYGHCRSIYVFPGQRVTRGQIIGEVGTTGIARGPHLHFEYRRAGRLRDPLVLFEGAPTS